MAELRCDGSPLTSFRSTVSDASPRPTYTNRTFRVLAALRRFAVSADVESAPRADCVDRHLPAGALAHGAAPFPEEPDRRVRCCSA